MKTIILFSLLCLPLSIFAQEKWIEGIIIIDNSDEKGEGIYITNQRSNHTTLSNFAGTFYIRGQVNDTLRFRSDWYENRKIVLSTALMNKDKIVVHLSPQTIQLQTAYVGRKLTGVLERDVVKGKTEDRITKLYSMLGVNPDIKPIQDTSKLNAGLFGKDIGLTRLDVGRIYDAFTGNLRRRAATISYEDKTEKIQAIRSYYGDAYFNIELGIPKFKINEFIDTAIKNSTDSTISLNNPNYFKLLGVFSNYSKTYLNLVFGKSTDTTPKKDSLQSSE